MLLEVSAPGWVSGVGGSSHACLRVVIPKLLLHHPISLQTALLRPALP